MSKVFSLEHMNVSLGQLFDDGLMQSNAQISIAISLKRIADSLKKSYELTKQSMPQPDADFDAMVAAHEPKYPTQGQELK